MTSPDDPKGFFSCYTKPEELICFEEDIDGFMWGTYERLLELYEELFSNCKAFYFTTPTGEKIYDFRSALFSTRIERREKPEKFEKLGKLKKFVIIFDPIIIPEYKFATIWQITRSIQMELTEELILENGCKQIIYDLH